MEEIKLWVLIVVKLSELGILKRYLYTGYQRLWGEDEKMLSVDETACVIKFDLNGERY